MAEVDAKTASLGPAQNIRRLEPGRHTDRILQARGEQKLAPEPDFPSSLLSSANPQCLEQTRFRAENPTLARILQILHANLSHKNHKIVYYVISRTWAGVLSFSRFKLPNAGSFP